ncbi:hypothetical protein YA12_19385 [Klebsiella aerogenes]|nr:hypothetical protein YA12_19385 [Klebsiella aerogenes]
MVMAQGLQCWDASGRLVVDIGDYNMRYMGTYSISSQGGVDNFNINVPGMHHNGWVAFPVNKYNMNEWYCDCQEGFFTAKYLPTGGIYGTYQFVVYKWEV